MVGSHSVGVVPRSREPPPPLPPETRTVGQLVAESVRLYQRRFWPSLALGAGPAATGIGLTVLPPWGDLAFVLTAGALLMTGSYIGATVIATEVRADFRTYASAVLAGAAVFAP